MLLALLKRLLNCVLDTCYFNLKDLLKIYKMKLFYKYQCFGGLVENVTKITP